ncbi:MAG: T9SS type A sorting domain-containing protein [Bacteroidia bacterium]
MTYTKEKSWYRFFALKLVAVLFLLPFTSMAQAVQAVQTTYDTAFIRTYGGVNFDEAREIRETPDGGFIIVGTTSSFGQGSTSLYAVKTDYMANHVWSKNYGGINNDWGYSVENTHDGGFLFTGFSNSFGANGYDGYIVKTDGNGTQLWQKIFGDYDWDFLYHSCALPDSGFVLCGETYSNSAGNSDAWLIRVNKDGDTLWTRKYGSYENEVFNSVITYNNLIYAVGKEYNLLTGKYNAIVKKYDLNGNIKGSYTYALDSLEDFEYKGIMRTAANKLVLTGVKSFKPDSTASIIMELDTALIYQWQDYGGYQSVKWASRSIENSKNYVITAGAANGGLGGTAMFMTSFNSGGNYLDAATFGGTNNEVAYSAVITQDKRMAFVGSTKSMGAGDVDMYLVLMRKDTLIHDHKQVFSTYYDTLSLTVIDVKEISLDNSVNLFPNPFSDKCTISISGVEGDEQLTLIVYDLLGSELMSRTVSPDKPITVNRDALASGTYFISINGKNIHIRKKLIIE